MFFLGDLLKTNPFWAACGANTGIGSPLACGGICCTAGGPKCRAAICCRRGGPTC